MQFLKEYKDTYIKFLVVFIVLAVGLIMLIALFSNKGFYIHCERKETAQDSLCTYQANVPGNNKAGTIPVNEILKAENNLNFMPSKGCIILKTTKGEVPISCLSIYNTHKPIYLLDQINDFISNKQRKKVEFSYNPGGNCITFYGIGFVLIFFIRLFVSLKRDINEFKLNYEDESSIGYDYKDNLINCGNNIDSLINKGMQLMDIGSYQNAERLFKSALSTEPNNYLALYCLANCYHKENKSTRAIKLLKQVISLNPHSFDAFMLLSEIYGTTRINYKKAIEYGLIALELRPNSASTHAWLAQMYCFNKKLKECYKHAHEALRLNPDLYIGYLALGLYYDNRKKYKMAKEYYHKALELSPNCDVTLNNLAALYINNGHYKEAYGLMRGVLLLNPQKELFQENFKIVYIRNHPLYRPLEWLQFQRFRAIYIIFYLAGIAIPGLICITAPFFLLVIYSIFVTILLKLHYNSALKNGTLYKLIDKE